MKKYRTSVIIPAYNCEDKIKECLDSILANKPTEIIVVNDGSTDNTLKTVKQYAKTFKQIKIIDLKKNIGIVGAVVKKGIDKAKGDIIFMTNADCVLPYNWIQRFLKHYNDEKVGAVGGGRIDIQKGCFETNALNTDNSSFRKNVLKKVGSMEEKAVSGEDTEFFLRIKNKGYKVLFDGASIVLHDHPMDFNKRLKKVYRYGKRGGQIARRYEHGKYMTRYFLIPVFWFPWKDLVSFAKDAAVKIIYNIGRFVGYIKS